VKTRRRSVSDTPRRKRPTPEAEAWVLQYKVVEISTVDEMSLESVLNQWVPQGWTFDGVQFSTRESSKRPAMAFVFFTRRVEQLDGLENLPARSQTEAVQKLKSLATEQPSQETASAWERLAQLADVTKDRGSR
jgi:hypothetical protein